MNGSRYARLFAPALIGAAALGAAPPAAEPLVSARAVPAATEPVASARAVPANAEPVASAKAAATEASATAVPARFENGDRIDPFFTALAVRFGVTIVQPKPVEAYILRDFDMPARLEDALAVLRQTLEPQGYSLLQSVSGKQLILSVVTTEEFKKVQLAQSPVSYGTAGEAIDISLPDRQVTHLLPITHPEMIDMLRRTATRDPDVSAEIAAGDTIGANLILTGPAVKVQRAVEAVAKIDKAEGGPTIARTLQLKHLDAQSTANALNNVFAHGTAPMKAVADVRTNSIIVTGPEDKVMDIMVTLIGEEAKRGPLLPPPATRPAPDPALKPGAGIQNIRPALDESASAGDNA